MKLFFMEQEYQKTRMWVNIFQNFKNYIFAWPVFKMYSVLKIDTKATCFLCYSSKNCTGFINGHNDFQSKAALKVLMRYLKVDLRKHLYSTCIQEFTTSPLESIDLSVSLCEDCSEVVNDFLEIFQSLEGVRLQLDLCIRQLHEFMTKGTNDSGRVQDYAKLMATGNVGDLIGSGIADSLREEMLEKVSKKVNSSVPRISLKDINLSANNTNVFNFDKKSRNNNTQVYSHPNLLPNSKPTILSESATEDPELVLLSSDDEEHREMECDDDDAILSDKTLIVDEDQMELISSKCSNEVNCLFPSIPLEDTTKAEDSSHSILCPNSASINPSETEGSQQESELTDNPKFKKILSTRQEEECMEVDLDLCEETTQSEELPQTDVDEINLPVFHECMFCGKKFSQAYTLRTHQLIQHTFPILTTEGVLPSGISEEELETNLECILEGIMPQGGQCSFCEPGEFRWKDLVRVHLVQEHLDRVIGNLENLAGENARVLAENPVQEISPPTAPTRPTLAELNTDIIEPTNPENYSGTPPPPPPPPPQILMTYVEQPGERIDTDQLETSVHPEEERSASIDCISTDPKLKKCVYCELQFNASYMTQHFYNNHAWIILSNKGLLPPGISEQQLEKALADILKQLKTQLDKCPHCELNFGYFKRKCHVKRHLLGCHLPKIIEQAEKIPVNPSSLGNMIKSLHKCSLCGIYFKSRVYMKRHQLKKHTMTVLEGRMPSSVSEEDMNVAVKKMISKTRIIGRQKTSRAALYECLWCGKGIWGDLRLHLIKCHLDKIIEDVEENKGKPSSSIPTPTQDNPPPNIIVSPSKRKQSPKKFISTSTSKYKCNLCPKLVTSLSGLKMHYASKHLGQDERKKLWKCEFCSKEFTLLNNLRCHAFLAHPVATFSDRLPPTISDQTFIKAVSQILGESSQISTNHGNEGTVGYRKFKCPLCERGMNQLNEVRLHLVRRHLDKVIETIGIGTIGCSDDIGENCGSDAGPESQSVVKEEGAESDEIEPWKLLELNLESNVDVYLEVNYNTEGQFRYES